MCHPDQTLSQDLVSKGKGIKPRMDEGLVGTSYILFPRGSTKNWLTPEKTQVSSPFPSLLPIPIRISKKVKLPFRHDFPLDASQGGTAKSKDTT
jgi:hypothetical protein